MQVFGSFPLHIFGRNKPRFEDQVLQRAEKLTIKMSEIIEEMGDQMPETFFRFQVLLPAHMTISAYYLGPTIQTSFFFSLG
jgi:hypothetical protein